MQKEEEEELKRGLFREARAREKSSATSKRERKKEDIVGKRQSLNFCFQLLLNTSPSMHHVKVDEESRFAKFAIILLIKFTESVSPVSLSFKSTDLKENQ